MQLHDLKTKNVRKYKKPRVGRGGKRGTYSGKGVKGQKSRAGRRILPTVRQYIQRLPKLRGFRNPSLKEEVLVLNVRDLEKRIKGDLINPEVLGSKNAKILGDGEVKKAYTVSGVMVSKSAKAKIEKAGGSVK